MTEQGQTVYSRTYSRTKPDGGKETWDETVERVARGNLNLVSDKYWVHDEELVLGNNMREFQVVPGGRHLWATGTFRQHLFNCWVSHFNENPWEHSEFTFLRLMEGGGVGSNYSNPIDSPWMKGMTHKVHIVCDPEHPDYRKLRDAGVLSNEYVPDWGCFEVEDSREGWAAALVDLMSTYYREARFENRVFDVSRVRCEGSRLKTFGGRASGPLPLAIMLQEVAEVMNQATPLPLMGMDYMAIDHAIAKCVVSGGNRRSARMSIMRWDDTQIWEFLRCKQEAGEHWTTNISVEIDSDFWGAYSRGEYYAVWLMNQVTEGMLHNGEPGLWDSDYANVKEPNRVVCTNPCGEQCLEPWEPCNLVHVNLAAFVDNEGNVYYAGLYYAHKLATRFAMRATFGDVNDPKSAEVLARNRRIGVGHLGVASFLAMTGRRYSDPGKYFEQLLEGLYTCVSREAREYAHQLRIPVPVKLTTVAPTGTIAKMPGVSEGIHPIFSKYFIRRIRFSTIDPDQMGQVRDYQARGFHTEMCQYAPDTIVVEIPTQDALLDVADESVVEAADELSLSSMLRMQALYQRCWADNAVSFTANIDPGKYTTQDIAEAIHEHSLFLKGVTIFPETGLPQSPYERLTRDQYESYTSTEVGDGVDESCVSGACPVR